MHRMLKRASSDGEPRWRSAELRAIATDCSDRSGAPPRPSGNWWSGRRPSSWPDRVGEEFDGLIISTTKFGFFVELAELFVEGLVPIDSLPGERFLYHENTRKIIGERSRRSSRSATIRVHLDRVDAVEKKLIFSVLEPERTRGGRKGRRQRHTGREKD